MATRSASKFLKVDVAEVEGLVERLSDLNPADMAPLIVSTLNAVADKTHTSSREHIRQKFNLTDEYLQRRMDLRKATTSQPTAEISAKYGGVALSHYGAQQLVRAAVSPLRKLKGDSARGIPRGQKQGGVSVEVTRGGRRPIRKPAVFIAPNKRDTEGNPFVFQRLPGRSRGGKDRLRRLFGPAPYQLFRHMLPELEETVSDDIREQLLAELDEWLDNQVFA